MKIKLTRPQPRNPIVAAARFRLAGCHRRPVGGERQQAARALRRDLERAERSDSSP